MRRGHNEGVQAQLRGVIRHTSQTTGIYQVVAASGGGGAQPADGSERGVAWGVCRDRGECS